MTKRMQSPTFGLATIAALAISLLSSLPNAHATPIRPEAFVGSYELLAEKKSPISEIVIRVDKSTNTLYSIIAKAEDSEKIGTPLFPPMVNINLEPKITQTPTRFGCLIREQVSSSDENRIFSQIGDTYKTGCWIRTKYVKLEYSIQFGADPSEVVMVYGRGNSVKRMTFKRIPTPPSEPSTEPVPPAYPDFAE